MTEKVGLDGPPPHVRLIQLATAIWPSRTIYVAARLGLADRLDTAKDPRKLAELTGTPVPALKDLLISLMNLGILTKDVDDNFALTSLGKALITGAPGSARAVILLMARDRLGAQRVVAASRAVELITENVTGSPKEVPKKAAAVRNMAGSIGLRARRLDAKTWLSQARPKV